MIVPPDCGKFTTADFDTGKKKEEYTLLSFINEILTSNNEAYSAALEYYITVCTTEQETLKNTNEHTLTPGSTNNL